MYVKHSNGIQTSITQIKRSHPNVSFGRNPTPEALQELGYTKLKMVPRPSYDPKTQRVVRKANVLIDDVWNQSWEIQDLTQEEIEEIEEQNKQNILEMIAARRYEEETKGIVLNGAEIKTDHQSQMKVIGAALSVNMDPSKTYQWKAANGFIELDATTVLAIANAVDSHVQACFERESQLVEAVNNGTYEEEMLDQGWP